MEKTTYWQLFQDFTQSCSLTKKNMTPVLESVFKNVAAWKACNFIKKRLQHMTETFIEICLVVV